MRFSVFIASTLFIATSVSAAPLFNDERMHWKRDDAGEPPKSGLLSQVRKVTNQQAVVGKRWILASTDEGKINEKKRGILDWYLPTGSIPGVTSPEPDNAVEAAESPDGQKMRKRDYGLWPVGGDAFQTNNLDVEMGNDIEGSTNAII